MQPCSSWADLSGERPGLAQTFAECDFAQHCLQDLTLSGVADVADMIGVAGVAHVVLGSALEPLGGDQL